ncbi:MAG: sulfite exporter TauE/SafE family protein [Elainellaceae cyanobacterium]
MTLLLLGTVSFIAWFFSMLAAGGSPFILIPLVTVLVGSQAVAPVITTGMLVGNVQRVVFFWRDIDWMLTLWYLPGAIAGAVLGAYVFTQIHLEWLQAVLGIALLAMVANYWLGKYLKHTQYHVKIRAWHFLPISFFYAFGSGLVGSVGPVMNPAYLSYGLVKDKMIATKSLNVAITHVIKLVTYIALGALTKPFLIYGLIIGCAAIPANWLGKLVLDRMSNEQFRQVVFAFVGISGIFMIWQQRQFLWLW